MQEKLTRNEQILKYLVAQCEKIAGRTRFLKFVYLADYYSHLFRGRPISSFRYIKWHHGPFDKSFYDVLKSLKTKGLITDEQIAWSKGELYRFIDIGGPVAYDLLPAELHILSRVAELYQTAEIGELLDEIVYQTEPMKAVEDKRIGTRLNMQALNDLGKKQIGGLDIDTILRSRQEIREGKYFDFDEFLAEMSVGLQAANG